MRVPGGVSTRKTVPLAEVEISYFLGDEFETPPGMCCVTGCTHPLSLDCGGAAGVARVVRGGDVIGHACSHCVGRAVHN